ncbi:MAG: phosphatase PAP2 family protein [Treponema sp.]|nr:phosphatase PAP2 family protein [Treponema sp.]
MIHFKRLLFPLALFLFSCVASKRAVALDIPLQMLHDDAQIKSEEQPRNKLLPYFIGSGEYFKLNPVTDPVLLGSSIAAFIVDLNLHTVKSNRTFSGMPYNRDEVKPFDRWAMKPYSRSLDITASIFVGAVAALPLALFATEKHEWITIFTMYAETMFLAHVAKALTKSLVFRPRPYMYFDGYPQKHVDSGDWNNSFPSGHTTMAFAAAGFTTLVFATYFPDSLWNIPVALGSYSLATAIAVLRICSGNHFFSDVLVGAAIGSVIGVGVPLLHKIGVKKLSNRTANDKVSLAVSPAGFTARMRF